MVLHPQELELSGEALAALTQILGIMNDQVLAGHDQPRWNLEQLLELELRLGVTVGIDDLAPPGETRAVTLGLDDVALLLEGMAFTEVASADLPWIDMVRWTSDFVAAQLRPYWTDDEWRALGVRG